MRYLYILLATTLFCSCNNTDRMDDYEVQSNLVEVSIPIQSPSSRTSIDGDEKTVNWEIGDQVALWAKGEVSSESDLAGECFTLRYYGDTFSQSLFAATIAEMSSEQEYSYSAFYPHLSTISGSSVSYTIPTSQSGEYDGLIDFRVADEVTGRSLTSSALGAATLSFRSLMHILKITIPEGYNKLGVPVKELIITFPDNVAGVATLDMSDTTVAPTLTSNQSSTITLYPTTPIDAGDGQELWLFINPMSNVSGSLSITGVGTGNEFAYNYDISLSDHTFSAGHITPVYTEIGEEIPSTTIQITIANNYLGEELTNVNLTAPSGAIFKESGTNTISIDNDGSGIYKASYITDFYGDKFSGATLSVEYESKWALVSEDSLNISLAAITENEVNNFSRTVPHILYENFDDIETFSKDDNTGVGGTDSTEGDQDIVDLSSYGLSTSGWTATRVGGSSGTAIRLCCRYEYGTWFGGAYPARLDSPTLKYIKDGAKISVSYNYKGSRYSKYNNSSYNAFATWKYGGGGNVIYDYGTETRTESTSDGIIFTSTSYTGFYGSNTIESPVASSVTVENTYVGNDCGSSSTINTNSQTYTGISYSNTYETYASTSTRLSWRVSTDYSRTDYFGTNGNFWFYLDNVVVTIAQQ